jgi:hypothetical protein
MKKNLFRALVLSAFVLRWTTLLLAQEHAAERSFVHRLFTVNLVLQRNCAARFAWDRNWDCDLYNSEMLSAAPFRTDNIAGISEDLR